MEHDFERTIREKIEQAEQRHVSWNKNWVRSRIGLVPSRRTFAFYYAAASLILATAIFLYGAEQTRQMQLEVRLKSIELSIEQNKAQAKLMSDAGSVMQPDCVDPGPITPAKESPREKSVPKSTPPNPQVAALSPVEIKQEEPMVFASTQTEIAKDTLVVATTRQAQPSVRAIIGGDPNIAASNNKEKKFRISLFPQVEESAPPDAAPEKNNFLSKNQ